MTATEDGLHAERLNSASRASILLLKRMQGFSLPCTAQDRRHRWPLHVTLPRALCQPTVSPSDVEIARETCILLDEGVALLRLAAHQVLDQRRRPHGLAARVDIGRGRHVDLQQDA